MYQDRAAAQQQSEKFLLGETVKQMPPPKEEKRMGQIGSAACAENEAFLKMVEDPLVFIKQRELEARHAVFDNPLKMKQIKEEIEALKNGGKKDKKHKKKSKKRKRSSSS